MSRLTVRACLPLVASLLLAACDNESSGFPADRCRDNCVVGNETLVVAPSNSLLVPGSERQLRATLINADGSSRDVTESATWTSASGAIVAVSADGLMTGIAPGATTVTAALPTLSAQAQVAVTGLQVAQLVVSPAYRRLLPGLGQQYTAKAVLSDGATVDVTSVVTWSVGNTAVASIDANGLARALAEGVTSVDASLAQGATSFSGTATLSVRAPIVTIEAFTIDPLSATTLPSGRVAFRAFVVTSDDESLEVTADVVWLSSNTSVASIDSSGVATAAAVGVTSIQATLTYLGQLHLATAELVVVAPTLTELRVSPGWAERLVGQQQAYTATAVFSGGRTIDVTERVLWKSLAPSIASVDAHGVASALTPGQTTIAASLSFQGISGSGDGVLVVDAPPPVLQSLSVVPSDATVLVDDDLQYRCIATFSDGSLHDVTGHCIWSVADPAIAVIDGIGGLLTGISAGSTTVEARWNYQGVAVVGTTPIEVVALVAVAALQITPTFEESIVLGTQQFHAHALLTDGRKIQITSNVAWTSDDPAIASIDAFGLARARSPGVTPIRAAASHQGTDYSDAAALEVTPLPVTVEEFRVVPPRQIVYAGGTTRFEAELLLSDGATVDVTERVSWTALVPAVARSTEQAGEFVGLQPGQTGVEAAFTYLGTPYSSRGELLVVDPNLTVTGLEIEPPSPVLATGGQREMQALLLLGTGDAIDVTRRVLWSSADNGIATIDAQGLTTGVGAGTTELSAVAHAGNIDESDSVPVRVLDPAAQLVALRVSPRLDRALIGTDTKFTATAYYLDGSRDDVSAAASWTIADTNVAELISQDGLVHANTSGTTTITARYNASGTVRMASALLVVAEPLITITEIQVTPARERVASGNAAQFHATAILSDFFHVEVTNDVQWTSGDPRIAQATASPGEFDTLQPGQVTVSALLQYRGQDYIGQAELIVRDAQPAYLEVSPSTLRLTTGESMPLSAILHFTDDSTEDVTRHVFWRTADRRVARVGSFLRPGIVTGVEAGLTTIDATYRGSLTASAPVRVDEPVLLTIDVLPAATSIATGSTQRYQAIGAYSDDSAIDITDRVLWSSSDEAIAAIVGGAREGRVEGVAPGTVTISAALDGVAGNAALTVTAAVAVALEVGPESVRVRVDGHRAFIAVAIFSDGSLHDVTDEATWTSSAPLIAAVSNESGSEGVAQGLAAGTSQIRATLDGTLQAFGTLQVLAPIAVSLVVTPTIETVSAGSNVYYEATLVLNDTTELDVTDEVRWTSSDPEVASISNGNHEGKASALEPGVTTIRASLATLGGMATLTVTPTCDRDFEDNPQDFDLDAVAITSDVTIRVGETAQLQILGVYEEEDDGDSDPDCFQDLTEDSATTWDSNDEDVFTIGRKSGIVTGIGPGTAQVDVRYRGREDAAMVTVLP